MKLYNGGSILAGLAVFLGLVTMPFWVNGGAKEYASPKLKAVAPENGKQCVESTEFMRKNHMELLNSWRDWALRNGERTYVNSHGQQYAISLQNTCLKCHDNKAEFCDKCHNEASVSPYCWDCHIQPEGYKK